MFRTRRMKLCLFAFAFSVSLGVQPVSATSFPHYKDSLNLKRGDQPHLVMEFDMSPRLFQKIKVARGQELNLENTVLRFNGDTVTVNDGHLHGQSTLYLERKSFTIETEKKIRVCEGCEALGDFYLVSLSMDRNYFHNRLSFDLLRSLGLFHLQYHYSEVRINGESQGIYLILQRPQDWALKIIGSPYIVRRGNTEHLIDRERSQKDLSKELKRTYHDQFLSIYKLIYQYSGEELYKKLNEVMYLDDYMRWLAFNYIIKCGDYSDELYFYADPETKRFRIVPWDYDDIFMIHPHEGLSQRNSRIDPSSMVFSSEDRLDVKIANDPYLYGLYVKHLSSVFEEISKESLEKVLENIYTDLSPLFESSSIMKAASKDGYQTNSKLLRAELNNVYEFIEGQRRALVYKNMPK